MSAIWGCVDLGGAALAPGLGEAMERPYRSCRIDRFAARQEGNVVMGCAIQYITREAENEPLPIFCGDEGLYFTADCFLDNRAQLLDELRPPRSGLPDGELLFLAYKKWGEDTPKHVLGSFSYAVYDKGKNRLLLCADHVFSRCVYYARAGSRVYFSTLMEPIVLAMEERPGPSDEWIAGYLASSTLGSGYDPELTVYRGVRKVLASRYMLFDRDSAEAVQYWFPERIRPLRLGSDGEYAQRLRALMETAAREATRTQGQVGILLSSGLDSTSAATFAAPVLAERGKKLYSFTSVPIPGFENKNHRHRDVDESGLVELFCGMYPNIEPTFGSFAGKDVFSEAERIVRDSEMPMKTTANYVWLDGFMAMAAEKGCRVMLNGQSGNLTISAGDLQICAYTLLRRGRPFAAFRALHRTARRLEASRKRVFLNFAKSLVPSWVLRIPIRDYMEMSVINREFAARMGLSRRDRRLTENTGFNPQLTFETARAYGFNLQQFSQIGEGETKKGLRNGLLVRDITRDIRVIELCMSMPMECFVDRDGAARRLVRCYLQDKFPPQLLLEKRRKGLQGADWIDRFAPRWGTLYPEIARVCASPLLEGYVDRKKVAGFLEKVREAPDFSLRTELIQIMALYFLGLFLEQQEGAQR